MVGGEAEIGGGAEGEFGEWLVDEFGVRALGEEIAGEGLVVIDGELPAGGLFGEAGDEVGGEIEGVFEIVDESFARAWRLREEGTAGKGGRESHAYGFSDGGEDIDDFDVVIVDGAWGGGRIGERFGVFDEERYGEDVFVETRFEGASGAVGFEGDSVVSHNDDEAFFVEA